MRRLLLLTLITLAVPAAPALAAPVPDGADWSQAFIPSANGVQLHADILRPKNVPAGTKVPVIVSIGPYFNHSGQTGPAGPAENTTYDPIGPNQGPSDRFLDFVQGARLMQRGYAYVMVDLRGFGGSNGCLDWGGPGEQADVVNAVNWAAAQPWSNGNVGMYGKSYDAVTGLIGVDKQPAALKAVVAQEPVYDMYRYLYGDGIKRENAAATPALYDLIAATPGPATDDPNYNAAAANDPACLAQNWVAQASNDNHDDPYWKVRNLIPGAKGSQVPLFLTQGLTENNTVPDGTQEFLDNHTGYERAWLGPWDHVRGNETCPPADPNDPTSDPEDCPEGRLKMGRAGWFDEVMRFYDRFLVGRDETAQDPPVAVQTFDGKWRSEESWPPVDARMFTTTLRPGEYQDTSTSWSFDFTDPATSGVWTISPKLPYDVHLAGAGRALLDVQTGAPNQNLVVNVYDVDEKGNGVRVSRQGHLLRQSGKLPLTLWSADWNFVAGHRIAVRVTDNNRDYYLGATGTQAPVTIKGGTLSLPFLTYKRTRTIQGDPGVEIRSWKSLTATLDADLIKSSESGSFALPPELQDPPPPVPGQATGRNAPQVTAANVKVAKAAARRMRARIRAQRRGRLLVSGAAPSGTRLLVRLRRAGRTVKARRVTARRGGFHLHFRVRRGGRYSAIVTGKIRGQKVRVPVRSVRARLR